MNEYVISTDSTADLPESYVAEHNIAIQDLSYRFGDEVYGKAQKLSLDVFYSRMSAGEMPSTNATNTEEVRESFESILKEGKDILHIAFSSALSASCSNAVMIANELRELYPERKILVIDSLSAALGQGLLVHYCVLKKEAGESIDDVCAWAEENKKYVCHKFTVTDLFHLQRGGRVSKTVAVIGTLVNVKPVLHVDDEGRLTPVCNVRGRKKALQTLVDQTVEASKGFENPVIFIGHGNCEEEAQYVADLIKEKGITDKFLINFLSPTVGAHAGVGTVAVFFMGNPR